MSRMRAASPLRCLTAAAAIVASASCAAAFVFAYPSPEAMSAATDIPPAPFEEPNVGRRK